MSFTYSYDQGGGTNNGDVMQITNTRDTTRSTVYTYDKLNRLSSAGTSNTTTWGDAYVYDPFGNLLQENVTQGTAENLQVTVDANNHINTGGWTYDAAGNTTWEAGRQNALKYDAENRLNPVTGYVYSYDGDGHRVEKNNAGSITYFWYDSDGKVISTTGALVRDYAYFNGRRLAYFAPSSGNQHYYWSDDLRSASVMSNSSGDTIEWEADYYPFGTANVLNPFLENYFRFTDYQWDPEMGYYFAGAREQGPNIGRFLSPDWSATPAAVPYAKLPDPQSLNLYSYARNNPISNVDPDGHDCDKGDRDHASSCDSTAKTAQKQAQTGVLHHLRAAFGQTTLKVTIGAGIGGKVEAGPGKLKLEAAAKVNATFSAGKLSVSKAVDVGATAEVRGREVGFSVSTEQVMGSVNVDTGQRSGAEPASGETVSGVSTKSFGGQAGHEGFEFGGEEGEGLLGGGSISISKEGVSELKEALTEIKESVSPY